jgi:hypothetical protein
MYQVPGTAGGPSGWFDTGLDLTAGVSVMVTATGTAHYCDSCVAQFGTNDVDPNGRSDPGGPTTLAPTLRAISLIARVGSAAPVFVGTGPTRLTGSGRLQFAINDNFFSTTRAFSP